MAGHAILPGCQREWRHDCTGRDESVPAQAVDTPPEHVRVGGVVCSCPCHGLQREIQTLKADIERQTRHLQVWARGYAETANAASAEIDRLRAALAEAHAHRIAVINANASLVDNALADQD